MVSAMAIVIEYYLPEKFPTRGTRWIPPERRGRIIPFQAPERNQAENEDSALGTCVQMTRYFAAYFRNRKEQKRSNINLQ
jgi:hypothetical protein